MENAILKKLLANKQKSIKEVMRVIDKNGFGIAFLVDEKKMFFGIVTDGDIRRAILRGVSINKPIEEITNKRAIVIEEKARKVELSKLKTREDVKEKIPTLGFLKVPVIDEKGRIKDIIFVSSNKWQRSLRVLEKKLKFNREGIKKVLLIGGAGYLGSVLCRRLLKENYKVRVLDNLTYGDDGIRELYDNKNFEFLKGDIRNISDIVEAMRGVDSVIHLAAIVGDPACALDTKKTIEINYLSTKTIADICKFNQINKFAFASTCSVYGASGNTKKRLTENSFLNPVSLYAEMKLKSEEGIMNLADDNFSPTIFRFATLFGVSPRMRFDLVVNTLTAKAVFDKKISIFGGEQWRPNLDVSDAAEIYLKWLESPIEKTGGEIFNAGANNLNCQIIKIGKAVQKIIPETKIVVEKIKDDLRDYNVSFDKVSRILNFKPKKTIERGILEVRDLIRVQKINNFNDPKYSNYRFLSK